MPFKPPAALAELTETFSRLPGIGTRTAERLATALMDWKPELLRDFGEQIGRLRERIHVCATCGNLGDGPVCSICLDTARDPRLICVVETPRQIPVIEKAGRFHGLYHVLGGRLSPLDGIDAEDLNIESLHGRIDDRRVSEVILATSPDVEGEATATYLGDVLRQRHQIAVSRIALGVPLGADLTFADAATMALALESRRPVSDR